MAIYYVSTIGRNTDPGTLEKPWRTLAYAESKLSSGDVVYVRGGVYQEYFKIDVPGVTFRNYPGESPIIDGDEEIPGDWIPLVEIASDNVTFDGFEVRESSGTGISLGGNNNTTIKNCEIHETYRQALQIINSDNALIEDCNIYKGAKVYYIWNDTRGRPPTVTTKYSDSPTFRRCKIHDSYFENIDIDVGTTNATIEYCEIYG
ncbi:MAG: right-handed parallel beta-helix repeat-containing protein, partial [Candidatus Omnitrophica bacterium]|nr:right-handed parallel beta-helix repeat-containing protein [Candidatus Omnitrophota bacterium]